MPLPDAPATPTPPQQQAPQVTPGGQEPMGYQDLYDAHQRFIKSNPDLSHVSLHDFSQIANDATGSKIADQGLHENVVRNLVAAKNDLIKPVTDFAGSLGQGIDQLLGTDKSQGGTNPAQQAARGVPETLADLGVVAAPTILDPVGGEAVSAGIAPLVFGGSGAVNTYGDTGSLPAAGVAGVAGALLPKSGQVGADLLGGTVNKYLGREATEKGLLPEINPVLGKLADFVGANAGIVANQELAGVAQAGAVGGLPAALDSAKHIFSVDNAIGQAVGLAPFAGHELLSSHFGKAPEGASSIAQAYRDQENFNNIQKLDQAIKEKYLTTATQNKDVQNTTEAQENSNVLTPEKVEQNLNLNPSGKSAADAAKTIKLGLNGVVQGPDGLPVKNAAESAEAIKEKLDLQDEPDKTLFQQPIQNPVKSAVESAQAIEEANAERERAAQSAAKAQGLKSDLKEQEVAPLQEGAITQHDNTLGGQDIEEGTLIKGGDSNGRQETKSETSSASTEEGSGGRVQGLEPDGSGREAGKQDGQDSRGQSGDNLKSGDGKGDESVPLTLAPEVVELAHNPPSDAEGVQKIMVTNNHLLNEAGMLKIKLIRKKIQSTHDFDEDEMTPFTDEWITDHYNYNRENNMSDSENYADITAKAQALFRDNVNKVNAALLKENDRRKQERADKNKRDQQSKDTFNQRIQDLNETLATLSPEDRAAAEKDITAIAKEKSSGQQTQGEVNMYEAASAWLKRKPTERSGTLRGVMAKAYELGTREEMRSKSSSTDQYETDENGNIVKDSKGIPKKITKMPKSIDAPVGEDGARTGHDSLQEVHFGSVPESEWVDKEAEKVGQNPTAQETQKSLILKRVSNAIKKLENIVLNKGDNRLVLEAYKTAKVSQPRNPASAIHNLLNYARADMLQLSDHELVGHVFREDGVTPLSEESIHGERAKARQVVREMLNKLEGSEKSPEVSSTKVPKNKSISLDEMEELGHFLEEQKMLSPGTEIAFLQTADAYFTEYAKKLGLVGEEARIFTETSKRIAATMKSSERTRVLKMEGKQAFGVAGDYGKDTPRFVGMLKDPAMMKSFLGSSHIDFNKFLQLYVFGHESVHLYEYQARDSNSAQGKAFKKLQDFAKTMSMEDRSTMIDEMLQKFLPPDIYNHPPVQRLVKHMAKEGSGNVDEFIATVNGLIHTGMSSAAAVKGKAKDFREYLLYSPSAVQDFSRGAYLNLMKFGGALESFWRGMPKEVQKEGGFDSEKMAGFLHEATSFIKQFGTIKEEIDNKIAELTKMKLTQPGVYLDHWDQNGTSAVYNSDSNTFQSTNSSEWKPIVKMMATQMGMTEKTPDELFKKNAGMWNLMTSGHWAQKFPEMADVMELAHSFGGIVNEYIAKAVSPFLTKLDAKGNLVRDTKAEGIKQLVNDPKAYSALNKILQWQNANDSKLAPEEVTKSMLSGLNPQTAKLVLHYRDAMSRSMTDMATRIVAGKQNDLVKAAARLIQGENPTLKYGEYMGVAQDLVNAHLSAGSTDARTQMMAQAKLQQIMQGATPGVLSASRLVESLVPEFTAFQKQFLGRPGYTPETRQGPYMISYKEVQQDGSLKPFTLGFKTKAEATARYNKALKDGKTVEANDLKAYDRNAQGQSAQGVSSAAVEALSRFDNAAFKAAMQIAPDTAKDFQQYFQSGEGLLKELQSRGYRKNLMPRKLAGGREELDTFQEAFNYIQSMSRGLGKQEVRGQLMLRSNEAKVLAEPNLRNDAIQHVENTINPPVAEFNKLKEGIFQYFLGGNISSLFVDASHPFLSLAPFLIEKGSGLVGAYKNMAYAGGKIATSISKGLHSAQTLEDFTKAVGDKDLAQGLFKAKQERLLDHGILDEFRTSDDLDLLNMRAVATEEGGLFNSTADLLKNAGYQYLRATRQLFGTVSKYNNLNTYVASFKTARDQGNSVDDAHSFAAKAVNTVLPQGGRGSRPVVFSKLGKAQSLFGVMYSLQSYTTGLLSMHARLAADSLGQSGLQGKALSDARKALGTAILSQVALSGILGLPFAGATIALLQNIFPELQLSRNIREGLQSFGGSDKELGNTIADAGLKGVASMITGVDWSGRLGLGNILGTNPYNGFDASALLGPTGSLVQKMVLGMGAAVQGNLQGAAENMLPTAYKNLLDAYAFDKVGRDKEGNMLTQPTDASRFLSAVGLKTIDETNARDMSGMLKQSARASAVELKAFYNQVADQIAQGNMEGAKQLLYTRSQTDPSFSPQAGVKQAVQTLQNRQAPKDMLARVGLTNAEDAQKIASLFPPQNASIPSQTQDLLQKNSLERAVGIPGVGATPQAQLKEAQAVDYLISQYGISPSQARAMLSHTMDARQKLGQRQQAWTSGVAVPAQ